MTAAFAPEPTVGTPTTAVDLAVELMHAWHAAWGVWPTRASLLVLLAQSRLETGAWKACWNWNFGNVKAVGTGHPYYFKACTEVLRPASARAHLVAPVIGTDGAPSVRLVRVIDAGLPTERWVVEFRPPHPACAFRSFSTIAQGAAFYLDFLARKYATAWAHVVAGDAGAFVEALKRAGYFTADLDEYKRAVLSIVREYAQLPFVLPGEEVPAQRAHVDAAAVESAVASSLAALSWQTIAIDIAEK